MASKAAIATISGLLSHTLGQKLVAEQLDIWEIILEPLGDELAVEATKRMIRSRETAHAVGPGAIFAEAKRLAAMRYPTPDEAWRLAVDAAIRQRPKISWDNLPHPVKIVANRIGYSALADLRTDDFTTRAHFLAGYRAFLDRTVEADLAVLPEPDTLDGMLEATDKTPLICRNGSGRETPALEEA